MAFQATKREWSELYAFFRLLSDGQVYAGTPQVKKDETNRLPVAMIQREEHDGTRRRRPDSRKKRKWREAIP